jgi:capsular polysaccharide biosynthesis protein
MIICALIAFIISALLPAKFQSDIQLIVIQKQGVEKVDAFSATKSAEFLSGIFSEAIYTTSFFNSVQDAPFEVRRQFSKDPEKREKEWNKFITIKKVNNTGILSISVVDQSRKTAEETAKAIAHVLTTNSEAYHGGADRVEVRLIDGPNTPLRPTVPHILQNTILGAFFGMIGAMIFIYFFPEVTLEGRRSRTAMNDDEIYEAIEVVQNGNTYGNETEVVAQHFQKAKGVIEFDPEIEELHKRISNFHTNN